MAHFHFFHGKIMIYSRKEPRHDCINSCSVIGELSVPISFSSSSFEQVVKETSSGTKTYSKEEASLFLWIPKGMSSVVEWYDLFILSAMPSNKIGQDSTYFRRCILKKPAKIRSDIFVQIFHLPLMLWSVWFATNKVRLFSDEKVRLFLVSKLLYFFHEFLLIIDFLHEFL